MIRRTRQAGFTAVELLITLFIAAVFLFAGYQLYTQVVKDGANAEVTARLSGIVYARMRKEADMIVASATGICGESSKTTKTATETLSGIGPVTYTTTIDCPDTGASSEASIFQVTVSASYTKNGVTQKIDHATYAYGTGRSSAATDYNPNIVASRVDSAPLTTKFDWTALAGATYSIRWRNDTDAWTQVPGTTSALTYSVASQYRKQVAQLELTIIGTNQTYKFTASSKVPSWTACGLQNNWANYGGGYNDAGFTRTRSGIVSLKGLVRGGTMNTPICTLPTGFRPAKSTYKLIFQASGSQSSQNSWARVDILPTGEVLAAGGSNEWISLDGIMFIGENNSYAWNSGSWLNGWSNYGAGHATLEYTTDSEGRIHAQGLGANPATCTADATMTSMLANANRQPGYFMHMATMSTRDSANNFNATGEITYRTVACAYSQIQAMYYPAIAATNGQVIWKDLAFQNSWRSYNVAVGQGATTGSYMPPQCYKDPNDDVVIIRGLVNNAAGAGNNTNSSTVANINSLGCGSFSGGRLLLNGWMYPNNIARIDIDTSGNILSANMNNNWTEFSQVRFIAD